MNSYLIGGASKTANHLFAFGLLATNLFAPQHANAVETASVRAKTGVRVAYPGGSSAYRDSYAAGAVTMDQGRYQVMHDLEAKAPEFQQAVSDFYANLLVKQEPLDKEVSKALYDNLWDLYAR